MTILESRIARTDAAFAEVGGQLSKEEAKDLILAKLSDIASTELDRYLNTEKHEMTHAVENLWDKYAVSNQEMEKSQTASVKILKDFFKELRYFP